MMKKLLLLGIAAVALTAAAPAQAQLSLTGECGLARTMDANALPPMSFAVAADYVGSEDTFVPMRAEFGVLPGLEIGGNYWFVDTEGLDSIFGFNAKYRLPLEIAEGLGLAVGANYQIWTPEVGDDTTTLKITGVASYNLKIEDFTLVPTAGVIWESDDNGDSDENGIRVFASIVAMVMPNLGIGAEFISSNEDLDGEDADAEFWFGARFMPLDNLSIQAGMLNYADIGGTDPKDYVFHVGAQYAFNFSN